MSFLANSTSSELCRECSDIPCGTIHHVVHGIFAWFNSLAELFDVGHCFFQDSDISGKEFHLSQGVFCFGTLDARFSVCDSRSLRVWEGCWDCQTMWKPGWFLHHPCSSFMSNVGFPSGSVPDEHVFRTCTGVGWNSGDKLVSVLSIWGLAFSSIFSVWQVLFWISFGDDICSSCLSKPKRLKESARVFCVPSMCCMMKPYSSMSVSSLPRRP